MKHSNSGNEIPLEKERPLLLPAHALPCDKIIEGLLTDLQNGLNSADAQSRLKKYGRNELESGHNVQPLLILLHQVTNAMMIVSHISYIFKHAGFLTAMFRFS